MNIAKIHNENPSKRVKNTNCPFAITVKIRKNVRTINNNNLIF